MIDGHARVTIESVQPAVDGGLHPAKRVVGDRVDVSAIAYADGHDQLRCELRHRPCGDDEWAPSEMTLGYNDTWTGEFTVDRLGEFEFSVRAWVDPFGSWLDGLTKNVAAGKDVSVDRLIGAGIVEARASIAAGDDAPTLQRAAKRLRKKDSATGEAVLAMVTPEVVAAARRADPRNHATELKRPLRLRVDREGARHGAWYEFFPRSTGSSGKHGTFKTAEKMLEYVADLGFDVVYLPPIHPIGTTNRKGPNNRLAAGPRDPGSPWAIGSKDGGHRAVHPELGTLADFKRFVERAAGLGLEVALDIAFQCSPDHPLLKEHPEWFKHRPDGSIAYAENPPKKYEDIVPFDFDCEDWEGLWAELRDTFLFWIELGVTIFRVDNPHTKSYRFWEWAIADIKAKHPDVIFLAEAFTRPALLHGLAKIGFSQSYNYFPWRDTKHEIQAYLEELTSLPGREYLRPNLWPNTPDILTEYLQTGGRPAFMARFVLAATLGANYGIYGPSFELCLDRPREPGSEEYADSEKYEVRDWDLDAEWSLRHLVKRVNAIRRGHAALRQDWNLAFQPTDNDSLLAYAKYVQRGGDAVVTVVNIDPHNQQAGHVWLDLELLGLEPDSVFQAHDLLGGGRYLWSGSRNFVALDAGTAHIFVMQRRAHNEQDFENFG